MNLVLLIVLLFFTDFDRAEMTTTEDEYLHLLSSSYFEHSTTEPTNFESTTINYESTPINYESTSINLADETTEPLQYTINCENKSVIVEELQVSSIFNSRTKSISLRANWSLPADFHNCSYEYIVYLNNKVNNQTKNMAIEIENVYACQSYVVGIQISHGGETTEKKEKLTHIDTINSLFQELTVSDFRISTLNSTAWNVTWKHPASVVSNCITSYNLQIWTDHSNTTYPKIPKNETSYVISPLVSCRHYSIQIYPQEDVKNKGKNSILNETAPPYRTQPPVFVSENIGRNILTVEWKVDNSSINQCEIYTIEMECEAMPSKNHNLSWIEKKSSGSTNMRKSDNHYIINLENVSPFTNYTCKSRSNNSAGYSDWSQAVDLQTLPGVPSAPQNLVVLDKNSTSFTIGWSRPEKVPSAYLANYTVKIINNGPNYKTKSTCSPNISSDPYIDSVDSTVFTYTYKNAEPYYKYTITIYANNEVGEGSESQALVVTTETAEPEKPEKFDIEQPESGNDTYYDIIQPVSWEVPCSINGILDYFILTWHGSHTNQSNSDQNPDTGTKNISAIDNPDYRYRSRITNVLASYSYKVEVNAVLKDGKVGEKTEGSFITWDGYVPAPVINDISEITSSGFLITWQKPNTNLTTISLYNITIETVKPYDLPKVGCPQITEIPIRTVDGQTLSYTETAALPFRRYQAYVVGLTKFGSGHESMKKFVTTKATAPEEIRNLKVFQTYNVSNDTYGGTASIQFDPPCRMNDELFHYIVNYSATRDGFETHKDERIITSNFSHLQTKLTLNPEYKYEVNVIVVTKHFQNKTQYLFNTKAGVPTLENKLIQKPKSTDPHSAKFNITKGMFNEINGKVRYYSILLTKKLPAVRKNYGFWDGNLGSWPNSSEFYDLKKPMWNPFEYGNTSVTIEIDKFNDEPLKQKTEYYMIFRGFTDAAYRETEPFRFVTAEILDELDLGLVLGLTLGLSLLCALIIFIVILWRRRKVQDNNVIHVNNVSAKNSDACSINYKQFLSHYEQIRSDSNIIKSQFVALARDSKNNFSEITYAILPENRRKNRYTNILPYDETRVKLIIDEDDEIATDYINASYINGYSGKVEYIATQGPLPSTCNDFWKMIFQENVSIIVMVSQFVEQNKEKCFHYFPNNHERTTYGKYEVKCLTELHFGTYCMRTLSVSMDTVERTVIHMQYLEWPDFGVPLTTESMLQFCFQLRERARTEGGLIVVHCSAGVGRSGTLIATDILLQTIDDHRDINVYKTVLDLRKQRANMVQTEKQYAFIYSCLKDSLEDVARPGDMLEPLYENMATVRASSMEKNLIEEESPL